MNCKPGDLAVVSRVTNSDIAPYLGRVVRCVRVDDVHLECWEITPELEAGRSVYDGALTPLRDPGEDARDETLSWLEVPDRETTPAMLDREVEHG